MSSNLQLKKVCVYCNQTFTAKKSSTKYCSHRCNSRDYKDSIRKLKVSTAEQNIIQQVGESSPKLSVIQTKQFLDVQEVCVLLKCSESALRKLITKGDIPTKQIGRKHIIRRIDIDSLFSNTSKD
jgi:excisionase family DNA binding protein